MFLAGLAVFWAMRAALQPAYWGLRHAASQLPFALFLVGAGLHALAAVG